MTWLVCYVTTTGLKLFYRAPIDDKIGMGWAIDRDVARVYASRESADQMAFRLACMNPEYFGRVRSVSASESHQNLALFTLRDLVDEGVCWKVTAEPISKQPTGSVAR